MNNVTEVARKHGRNYITPEDVSEALKGSQGTWDEKYGVWRHVDKVRLDVLEVLAKQTEYGAEDSGLCAFVAWKGK